jgi:hypothetical protein
MHQAREPSALCGKKRMQATMKIASAAEAA